jgi:hypothetical protein
MLVAFADEDVIGDSPELTLGGRTLPASAPVDALDVRLIRSSEDGGWINGWRSDSLRRRAEQNLDSLEPLDAATCCYVVSISLDDPADLAHLQLGWAVAAQLAQAGSGVLLDVYPITWHGGPEVAALAPDRPFTLQREISVTAETEVTPGFGHAVHTRGMLKFGRPDLFAGVPADRIEHTGAILNHLARMLAGGATFGPGERFRFDGERTLVAQAYEPGVNAPEVGLNNDALLLVDV